MIVTSLVRPWVGTDRTKKCTWSLSVPIPEGFIWYRRMVSGRIKAHELERLPPWAWQAEWLAAAVHA